MSNYSNLTDYDVNAKLAEQMGWTLGNLFGLLRWWLPGGKPGPRASEWSPCTNRDDLAVVVRYIVDNGDVLALDGATQRILGDEGENPIYLLTCPQRVIAEACLEVLEVE